MTKTKCRSYKSRAALVFSSLFLLTNQAYGQDPAKTELKAEPEVKASVHKAPPDTDTKAPTTFKADFCGKADFYSSDLHGQRTASGVKYDENKLTAAHKKLPFGTRVTVVNRTNGKSCTLTINDRGPFTANRVIDVSKEAAKQLGLMADKNRMVDCFIRIDSSEFMKPKRVASREAGTAL